MVGAMVRTCRVCGRGALCLGLGLGLLGQLQPAPPKLSSAFGVHLQDQRHLQGHAGCMCLRINDRVCGTWGVTTSKTEHGRRIYIIANIYLLRATEGRPFDELVYTVPLISVHSSRHTISVRRGM